MLANVYYVLPSFSHLVGLNIDVVEGSGWKGLPFFCDQGVSDDRWLECTLDIQKSPSLEEKKKSKTKTRRTTEIYYTAPSTKQSEDYIYTRAHTNP